MDLQILKIAADNKYEKTLKKYTHQLKIKNSICGDEINIRLMVKNNSINNLGYEINSCVYCQASISLMSKKVDKMNTYNAITICEEMIKFFESRNDKIPIKLKFFNKLLNKENFSRKDCLLFPFKALKKVFKIDKKN